MEDQLASPVTPRTNARRRLRIRPSKKPVYIDDVDIIPDPSSELWISPTGMSNDTPIHMRTPSPVIIGTPSTGNRLRAHFNTPERPSTRVPFADRLKQVVDTDDDYLKMHSFLPVKNNHPTTQKETVEHDNYASLKQSLQEDGNHQQIIGKEQQQDKENHQQHQEEQELQHKEKQDQQDNECHQQNTEKEDQQYIEKEDQQHIEKEDQQDKANQDRVSYKVVHRKDLRLMDVEVVLPIDTCSAGSSDKEPSENNDEIPLLPPPDQELSDLIKDNIEDDWIVYDTPLSGAGSFTSKKHGSTKSSSHQCTGSSAASSGDPIFTSLSASDKWIVKKKPRSLIATTTSTKSSSPNSRLQHHLKASFSQRRSKQVETLQVSERIAKVLKKRKRPVRPSKCQWKKRKRSHFRVQSY